MTPEELRLKEDQDKKAHWRRWGPYLSERQWATVREDYSANGDAWRYFPHEHARSRAYRWGEDGLAGISDNHQRLCFAVALWNGQDDILKERVYGVDGTEGNHGEDLKDYYFYLDNTPTHSYMKCLYKYPQNKFPYQQLVSENRQRGLNDPEFELLDTGLFHENRYFDVFVEYAKADAEDILIQITVVNRGPQTQPIHMLPTLWFRNTWSWIENPDKPSLKLTGKNKFGVVQSQCRPLQTMYLYCQKADDYLFTENESNNKQLFNTDNASHYVKDAFHEFLIRKESDSVNRQNTGTKMAALYLLDIKPGESQKIHLRLSSQKEINDPFGKEFGEIFKQRKAEADDFYQKISSENISHEEKDIQRQAFAGMLWNKQFYHYVVENWIEGDRVAPPPERRTGRNQAWKHLYNEDILSMPDKWEYPWFAAWDAAFHMIPFAMIDPAFAKRQLELYTREWYMHPNGQLPAYEWDFSDVNPPVHAWAAMRVFQIEKKMYGRADHGFLERVFHKLLLNFTWWVNRKDVEGHNIFEGGFLGMDNIGIFDRSHPLPIGGHLHQADGTSWMAMYCLNLLRIALELAQKNQAYEDIASKFLEHFLYIAEAINKMGKDRESLWNEEDGFYFDMAHVDHQHIPIRIKSMVGLIPLFAIEVLTPELIENLPGFRKRMDWFIQHRKDLCKNIACPQTTGVNGRIILSLVSTGKLKRILTKLLNENEFLSPYGIRSVSKTHQEHPYVFRVNGQEYRVRYTPGESDVPLFGGNSNWRGPIWFPVNYLLIESLQKFHYYLGDAFQAESPSGSGEMLSLWDISQLLSKRLISIFKKNQEGLRPVYLGMQNFERDPEWSQYVLFFEYFHGDTGRGVGASHQTGWTGLVAKLIQQCAQYKTVERKLVTARSS